MFLIMNNYGCTPVSHVIVGELRSPADPSQVKIYLDYPEKYDKIALIEASSKLSFAITDQGKMNKVIDRLKKEAGKLGANGVVLENTDNESDVRVAQNLQTNTIIVSNSSYKIGTAIAIFVK